MVYLLNFSFLAGMILLAFLLSEERKKIDWKSIAIGFILQIFFAFVFFKTNVGQSVFLVINRVAEFLTHYSLAGSSFIFGSLVDEKKHGFIFALKALPTIIYLSTLLGFFYYIGVMQKVIFYLGWFLKKLLKISLPESICASSNIFLAQTEAPLVIKPYVKNLTRSELFTLMTVGMATTAGSVLIAYTSYGVKAGHLVGATLMSIPCAIVYSKIFIPGQSSKNEEVYLWERADSLLEHLAESALTGLKIALNIGAILIAFIALIATFNGFLQGLGLWTLDEILGLILKPVAYLLGVPWQESHYLGMLIGKKIILNEFIAFSSFQEVKSTLSDKSQVIASYVLCSFGNFSSMAIQIGAWGGIDEKKKKQVASLGLKALLAATMTSFTTSILAGIFYSL